jgi:Ring finger domain
MSLFPSWDPTQLPSTINPTMLLSAAATKRTLGSLGFLPFLSFLMILICFVCIGLGVYWNRIDYRTAVLLAAERSGMTTLILTPEELEEIGEFKYGDKCEVTLAEECAICLSTFENIDMCRELPSPCCHCFHKTCIDTWLLKSSKCPLCSRSIYGILAQMREEREMQIAVNAVNIHT